MKILQVLTYVSEDGAYGGPVAVAKEQCRTLAALGHEVHLIAGWDGRAVLDVPGVHLHLHRVTRLPVGGFAGYVSPGVWWSVWRLGRSADVIHFHLARDLVQLPASLAAPKGPRVVAQAHGMIRPDRRVTARILDALMTRRVYRRAAAHLVLTGPEATAASIVARQDVATARLRNGVPVPNYAAQWAEPARVVFISRLHPRKRPATFVQAAQLGQGPIGSTWLLYGADEGELAGVEHEIDQRREGHLVEYAGSVPPHLVTERMREAQVFVLPSVEEPFPMALLEAMSVGLPSVITDSTGVSDELRDRGTALVTDGSPAAIAQAVASLLADEATWRRASERARADIAQHFSPLSVARQLLAAYGECAEDEEVNT